MTKMEKANSSEQIDQIIEFKRKYQNKWVALDIEDGKVLLASSNLKRLVKSLGKKKDYVLEKVLPPDVAFIPFVK